MNKNEIYIELRRRICLLDYEPGTRLSERELAQEFGISRTPMRGVLQKLEYNGLISSQHGHGTTVTSIDLKSLRDIYITRMRLMDAMGDSKPAPIDPNMLEKMHQLEERCEAILHTSDKREFAEVGLQLHNILHQLTTNEILADMNDTLFYRSARFWFLLLDRVDMKVQVEDLKEEIKILRQSLEIGDIKLIASIHNTFLRVVLSRLDALQKDGNIVF
jgi:DNA-binding GntR family transcriptional regulator